MNTEIKTPVAEVPAAAPTLPSQLPGGKLPAPPVAGASLREVSERLAKNSKARPSPLLNTLINRVVKEQKPKEENMYWENLVDMHNQIGAYLLNLTTIAAFMRNKQLRAVVEDRELLIRLVTMLAKDMAVIQKRALATYAMFPTKSGLVEGDEQMMLAVGIYEDYNNILLDIVQVLMPTSNEVMEIFTVAERVIVELEGQIVAQQEADTQVEAAAAALIDPTVVSDVSVKEVTVKEEVVTQHE